MSTAVDFRANTGVGTYDFYVLLAVSYAYENLVKASSGSKSTERGAEGDFSAGSKSCRNAYHICLCNAYVEKSVGIFLFERTRLYAVHKVCLYDHDILVGLSFFYKRLAVYLSHLKSILHQSLSFWQKLRHCSSVMDIEWQP